MTQPAEPPPEPSNADLLAAITAIATAQSEQGAALTALTGKVDALAATQAEQGAALTAVAGKLDDVETKVDRLADDVMAVKVDTGFIDRHIADFQGWARAHQGNPDAHRPAA